MAGLGKPAAQDGGFACGRLGAIMSWIVRVWLAPVRFYRRYLSPLKGQPTCRYLPTCSQYAIEAVEHHGIFMGTIKAVLRLLRCNPLFTGGYDPVYQESVDPQEKCRH